MTRGELIADELRRAVNGDAWHGPALLEALADVSASQAVQHPIPDAHSIWELVLHITAWANIALRRIHGGDPAPQPGENFPDPGEASESRWQDAISALVTSHESLCDTVASLTEDDLARRAPESSQSIAFMLHGVAQHDAYHGGQIVLLARLLSGKRNRGH